MVRCVKIVLSFLIALWGGIGALGNLAKPQAAYEAVRSVTTMPMFPAAEAPPWATDTPLVVWSGVAMIVAGKLAALLFCGYGAFRMARAFRADSLTFARAKQWSVFGGGLAVAFLFAGFTVIGETLYLMFMSDNEHAAAAAFRYGGLIALLTILIAQDDPADSRP